MTTLRDHIESLRSQVNAVAAGESEQVRALGQAIAESDNELISEVRRITAMHEQRRYALVAELSALAVRIGFLPPAQLVVDDQIRRSTAPPIEERFSTTNGGSTVPWLGESVQ